MKEKIKILFVISDLSGGGTEREMALLISRLDKTVFEPRLFIWRDLIRHSLPSDMPIVLFKKKNALSVIALINGLSEMMRDWKPDVVFSQLRYVNLVTGCALRKAQSTASWICRYTSDPDRELKFWFESLAHRFFLKKADFVIGVSQRNSNKLQKRFQISKAKVSTIPNMIDLGRASKMKDASAPLIHQKSSITFVYAGRHSKEKNIPFVLRCLARLKEYAVHLWMLGEGPLTQNLKKLASELKVEEHISWLGFVENPYPYFKQADCMLLTSHYEGLPSVLIESLCCGTPVISTRSSVDLADILMHEKNGLVVDQGHEDQMVLAMRRFIEDEQLRNQLKKGALGSDVHKYDSRTIQVQYEQLFKKVFNGVQQSRSR